MDREIPDGPELVILLSHVNCNYKCRFCCQRLHEDKLPPWPLERITDTCSPLWETAKLVNLGSTGEIGLWPYLDEAIDFFSKKGIKVCFTSNGRYLNAKKLHSQLVDSIMVSLHTVDEDVYDNLTGTKGNLPRVMQNLLILGKQPRNYQLSVSVVLTNLNIGQAPDVARFCKFAGVDLLKLTPLVEPDGAGLVRYDDDLILQETEENSALLEEAKQIMGDGVDQCPACRTAMTFEERRSRLVENMPICTAPYEQTVINYDGNVIPCCFLGGEYSMGNIFETPWKDIWFGDKYMTLRKSHQEGNNPNCLRLCRNWG
jgi:radical SAM protein with 4Fe4S-binding SPASM domain